MDRPNLSVLVGASVRRVRMEKTGTGKLSAVGVEFMHGTQTYAVNAREEVILAAGYRVVLQRRLDTH